MAPHPRISPDHHPHRVDADGQSLVWRDGEGQAPTAARHLSAIVQPLPRERLCHDVDVHLEEEKGLSMD